MVGYGNNYPQRVHHRASSIVSIKVNPSFVSCRGGYATWFSSKGSDPNLLVGAVVGGPDAYDNFGDRRDNYEQTEPATYNNAPILGILARLNAGHGGYNQLLPGIISVSPSLLNPFTFPISILVCKYSPQLYWSLSLGFLTVIVPAPTPVVTKPSPAPKPKTIPPTKPKTTPAPGICLSS